MSQQLKLTSVLEDKEQNILSTRTSAAQDEIDVKELSKLSKEEWREYTKSVWSIANTSHPSHPAVFPVEIPRRLINSSFAPGLSQ
ncbi:hypothetical protein GCM10025857_07670 [Alicyclobacillus contaminans]|nr:hypothetical protein GCM10025857_07670 [Alicyclobacillus contaminans]